MTSIRFVSGKVWAQYLIAVVAGVVVVIALNALWKNRGVLPGGLGGLIAVVVMLLPGVIKRSSRTEPVITIDGRGINIDLLGIGTVPWARISGSAWWTGQRLIIEYIGTAPKPRFWAKLNWGLYAKQKGEVARLTLGTIGQTDQTKSVIEGRSEQGCRTRSLSWPGGHRPRHSGLNSRAPTA